MPIKVLFYFQIEKNIITQQLTTKNPIDIAAKLSKMGFETNNVSQHENNASFTFEQALFRTAFHRYSKIP